jgi:hypothetical protein
LNENNMIQGSGGIFRRKDDFGGMYRACKAA